MAIRRSFITTYRLVTCLLILIAITVQAILFKQDSSSLVNFFSYFTILSAIFTATVFTISLFVHKKSVLIDHLRGTATLCSLITILGFVILFSGDKGFLLAWVNLVIHYVCPIVVLIDWILVPISKEISFKKASIWAVLPVCYLAYSFIRGAITLWYPYYFLDPKQNSGYGGVFIYVLSITLFGLLGIRLLVNLNPSKIQK